MPEIIRHFFIFSCLLSLSQMFPVLFKPLTLYKDGRHVSSSNVMPEQFNLSLVAGCSTGHKLRPLNDGKMAKLKTQHTFFKDGICHFEWFLF